MQTAGKAFKGIQREESFGFSQVQRTKGKYIPKHPTTTKSDIKERYERFQCIIAYFDI